MNPISKRQSPDGGLFYHFSLDHYGVAEGDGVGVSVEIGVISVVGDSVGARVVGAGVAVGGEQINCTAVAVGARLLSCAMESAFKY